MTASPIDAEGSIADGPAGHADVLGRCIPVLGDARTDPRRLAAVRATGLLDSEVEEVFDRLTRLAVRLLRVPASFISLVDEDRDFYKSACGFGEPLASARELRGPTFCHFTVKRPTPLVIPDTAADPVYSLVPTVRSMGVAAYVGVPLVIDGQAIGAFCTIDTQPRAWTEDEVELLVELAGSAQREMQLRGAIAVAEAANASLHQQATLLAERTEEAESANRAKAGFLAMMSHELRAPLTAVGWCAELLIMGVRGAVTPDQREYLFRIRRAGRHLETLIGDILEYARVEAGRARFELADVDVSEVVSEAAEMVAPQVEERGVVFGSTDDASCEGETPCLARADPSRLRQVLVNLMVNAVKFTPPGGRVWVTTSREGGRVCIAVSDTGRGIPTEDQARIFQPFVQLDRDTDAHHKGVGLGLSICRELARAMDGDLSVSSAAGAGSTFTVSLPAAGANVSP